MLRQFMVTTTFEPKHLDFRELAKKKRGQPWKSLSHAEQVDLLREALQADHYLIDPHCEYMRYWDLIISIALVFTGIVTPYEVIFMQQVPAEHSLFIINRIVDLIFVKDMIMQFFLKIEMRLDGKYGTTTLKDPKAIRRKYLGGWFPIDFVSVLPFDIFFLSVSGAQSMSGIKILRCIRLLRLIKLVRILRTSRLILRWQNYFAISFASQKLAKFSFILVLASHWLACVWGLVGLSVGAELCDADGTRLSFDEDLQPQEMSWMTVLFLGGKTSPDSPCEPWHVYTVALYWSVMTITSIGYGDIVPVRNEEYICCVICMLIGGVLWAYIIGSTCGIIANNDPVEGNFETNTDLLNVMMREAGVEKQRRQTYREYLREAKAFDSLTHFREVAQCFSPQLKGELLLHVTSRWNAKIWYLAAAPERCVMELCDQFCGRFYAKREGIQDCKDDLSIIDRGTVVCAGIILTPGCNFRSDFIVSDPLLRKIENPIALAYALILSLGRDPFFATISKYPTLERTVRFAAMKIAFARCIYLCAQRTRAEPDQDRWPSLTEVFRGLSSCKGTAEMLEKDSFLLRMSSNKSVKELQEKTQQIRARFSQHTPIVGGETRALAPLASMTRSPSMRPLADTSPYVSTGSAMSAGGAKLVSASEGSVIIDVDAVGARARRQAPVPGSPPRSASKASDVAEMRLLSIEAALKGTAKVLANQLEEVNRHILELRTFRMDVSGENVVGI